MGHHMFSVGGWHVQETTGDVPIEESHDGHWQRDYCVGGQMPREIFPKDWGCKRVRPKVVNVWNEMHAPFFPIESFTKACRPVRDSCGSLCRCLRSCHRRCIALVSK